MPRKIEISHRTIVFATLFLVFLWFIYYISDILLQLFVSLLIAAILNPLVTRLTKFRIPRALSIFAVYILAFGVVGTAVAGIVPPMIEQTTGFASKLPEYVQQLGGSPVLSENFTTEFLGQLGTLPAQAAKFAVSLFSNVFAVLTVLIFAFYLLLSRDKLAGQLEVLVGKLRARTIENSVSIIEEKLGGWARGQLALIVVIGLLTYIGLTFLGIPFAIPLAIIAGLLEIIPYLGPIMAAIPTILIGFSISPVIGVSAGILALIIQTLENYLLVPKIMQKSVGTNPVATILALLVGMRLAGPTGGILAIPLLITIQVVLPEYFRAKSNPVS